MATGTTTTSNSIELGTTNVNNNNPPSPNTIDSNGEPNSGNASSDKNTVAVASPSPNVVKPAAATPNHKDGDADEGDISCEVQKYTWSPPLDGKSIPYRPHQGEGSQYLRDFILGVNDGLISTFLIVVAVVAGGSTTLQSLLAAISAGVAGAIAMGIGEYVATKSQLQVNSGEMKLETEHFKYHRDVELQQLRSFLESVSLRGELLEAVVAEVGRSDESLMKMMMAFEFGVHADELERNPIKAMFMSGRLFLIGALPTIVPFFFSISPGEAIGIAAALVGATLFIVGAYKTRTTRGNPWKDGAENFILGGIATGISYAAGRAFDAAAPGASLG